MLQGLDCSPTYGERELGLDRRETGWFYPTGGPILLTCASSVAMPQYERNGHRWPLVSADVREGGSRSHAIGSTAEGL